MNHILQVNLKILPLILQLIKIIKMKKRKLFNLNQNKVKDKRFMKIKKVQATQPIKASSIIMKITMKIKICF